MMGTTIPKNEEIIKIATTLRENLSYFDFSNLEVVIKLDERTLNQLNEDFYYKNNPDGDGSDLEPVDEIDAYAEGILFKYIKKADD